MKLVRARVQNFRSIEDSNEFEIGDLTCLVGKNEAGKTAILHALHGLRPLRSFSFDKVRDYPRRHLSRFNERHEEGESEIIHTWWELSPADVKAVESKFGVGALTSTTIEVETGFGYNATRWTIRVDQTKVLEHLCSRCKIDAVERSVIDGITTTKKAAIALEEYASKTEHHKTLLAEINKLRDQSANLAVIDLLSELAPKFFYTSHFDRMSGEVALTKLAQDKAGNRLSQSDQIFLDFLEYAGTSLEELQQTKKFEELVAQCEGASNEITDEIFQFWSQNEALSVQIALGEGRAEDPAPFNAGTVAKIRIENSNHRASVPLSERSAGFVWFFSFLAQFKQIRKTAGNAILLLDEPGLTLHGKAQADLLRYIQERLLPTHQVIYSTHSPFMVPAERLSDVRVVEDVVERDQRGRPVVHGTKVSSDILSVDKDTLFPLQAHLGYEITQSLFIGKNSLLVEGPSDILFLQVLSEALKKRGREGLDGRWAICPTGGLDKVSAFASLFGGNKLNVAVLCDYGTGDKNKVERLKESQILKSGHVFTATDFTGKAESDVEDFFDPALYLEIVNKAYSLRESALTLEAISSATPKTDRLVKQVESVFKLQPPDTPNFDHFTPSAWLLRHPELLDGDSEPVRKTLDRAEAAFNAINKLAV